MNFKYLLPGNSTNKKFQYCETKNIILARKNHYVRISDADAKALLNQKKCWNDNNELVDYVPSERRKKAERNRQIEKRNIERQFRITAREKWFEKYDIQVAEYNRAVRLGIEPSIHIGDKVYKSIDELDADAVIKSNEIKQIKSEMEPYEE